MAPTVRFRLHRAAFFWAFLAVVPTPPSAYAQGQQVELTYIRDEDAQSCPDEAWLKQQIAGHLGYDPFIAGQSGSAPLVRQISCHLSKAPTGDEFLATLQTAEPNLGTVGRRELRSGPHCDALAASVVLSLSMAIDPIAAETARPPPPPKTSVTPAAPALAVTVSQPQVAHPRRLWLSGAGVVATGWQNGAASPLASLNLLRQSESWSVFIEGRLSASSSTGDLNLKTRLLLGATGLCRAWGPIHLCGSLVAGPIFVTSLGTEDQKRGVLVAAGPRLLWSRTLVGPLRVEATLEAYANVVRPRVLVDDVVTWRAAAGAAAVTLGLGWRLW